MFDDGEAVATVAFLGSQGSIHVCRGFGDTRRCFTFSNGLHRLHGMRQLGMSTDTTDIIGMYRNTKTTLAVVPEPWAFPFQVTFGPFLIVVIQ